jgi:glycosyltransferase involved in cell wall biosynthesis
VLRHEHPVAKFERWVCSPAVVSNVRSICAELSPQVVIAEYIFFGACLDAIPPGTFRVIDTHDMFSQKEQRVLAYGIEDALACTPAMERERLLKADLIIAIQSREARLMSALVPERRVITVGIDFDVLSARAVADAVRGRILVVGSDNPMNLHGLRSFIEQAWPAIRQACPWASLRVVGRVGRAIADPRAGVELAGWVESLADEYAAAEVVINPTIAGTGLKIKSCEALCHGKSLVVWPDGVDGMPEADKVVPFKMAHDWPGFALEVSALLCSPEARSQLEDHALRYAKQVFGRDRVYKPLLEELSAHFDRVQSKAGTFQSPPLRQLPAKANS